MENETYKKAVARLARMGIKDPTGQIIALEAEIDHYREKIHVLHQLIAEMSGSSRVVRGRWIPRNKGLNNWCECSECNTAGSPFWKRCPVCEAKMDGRSEGE